MHFNLFHTKLFCSIILLFLSCAAIAQDSGIKLIVKIKSQGKVYSKSVIEIKKDNSFYDKTGTPENGEFSYIFNYGAVYHIYFGGEGMATKCLELDLKEVPSYELETLHDWTLGELSLFKTYDNIDLAILEKPVGRIHYDEELGDFTIDYKYGASREKQMNKMHDLVADAQEVEAQAMKDLEKTYEDFISKGDEYYRQNNFESALVFYQKAAKLIPSNTKAPEKITLTNTQVENEAKFKDLVLAGDQFFQKEEWVLAKDQYVQASALKRNAPYPKSQLAVIAEKRKEEELLSNQFNNHMAVADVAYSNGNYVAAAAAYKKALLANPNAMLAKNKLEKSEAEIAKQDAATNRKQKSQALLYEARRAEQNGALGDAKQILEKALVMDPSNEGLLAEKKRVDKVLQEKQKKEESALLAIKEAEKVKREAELAEENRMKAQQEEFESWKKKGMAADQAGNKSTAIACFKKALEINPDDSFVKARVRTLSETAAVASTAKKTTKKKDENEFQALDKMDKKSDNFVALLAIKYPQGMTEKIYQEGNKKVTKRIVVKGNLGTEYMKIEHSWGGVYYFKNGEAVTEYVWQKEAK